MLYEVITRPQAHAHLDGGPTREGHSSICLADAGIFYCPPASIAAQFPQFRVTQSYAELAAAIQDAARRLPA